MSGCSLVFCEKLRSSHQRYYVKRVAFKTFRTSHRKVFCQKGVLHILLESSFEKVAGLDLNFIKVKL